MDTVFGIWKRRERGSYIATIGGKRFTIVNMKDGTNAPRWQGPVPSWEVRQGGEGDYDIGSETLHTAMSYGEAKSWVAENAVTLTCPKHGKILGALDSKGQPTIDICPARGCRERLAVS